MACPQRALPSFRRFNLVVDQLEALEELRSGMVPFQVDQQRVGDALQRIGSELQTLNGEIEIGGMDEQTLDRAIDVDIRWLARSIAGLHRSISPPELRRTTADLAISIGDGRARIALSHRGLRSPIEPVKGSLSEAESERLGVAFSLCWQVARLHRGMLLLDVPPGIRDGITVTFDLPLQFVSRWWDPVRPTPDPLKESFMRALSHELRSPMASLQGPWGLAADGLVKHGDEEFPRVRRSIDHGIRRFMALAADLDALSLLQAKKVSLDVQPVQVRGMLEQVVAGLQPIMATKRQSVVVEGGTPGMTIESDRTWLTRAISSLVTSASLRPFTGTCGYPSARSGSRS